MFVLSHMKYLVKSIAIHIPDMPILPFSEQKIHAF